jgi:uracil-DNA glycosylase
LTNAPCGGSTPPVRLTDEWGAAAETLSALGWWQLAGLDASIDEAPRDWLHPAPRPTPATPQPPRPSWPDTLAGFQQWLAAAPEVPLAGAPSRRVAPCGAAGAPLMILGDMPEPEDCAAGRLWAGGQGRLLDAMLNAIGQHREGAYLASMVVQCTPAASLEPAVAAELGAIARHHAALGAPRALLLLGEQATRAVLGCNLAPARGRQHDLNHVGGTMRVFASFHPRFLLQHPARKAAAWEDLQLLREGLSRP